MRGCVITVSYRKYVTIGNSFYNMPSSTWPVCCSPHQQTKTCTLPALLGCLPTTSVGVAAQSLPIM